MRVYNRVFRRRNLPWSYLTLVSERLPDLVGLLRQVGAIGCSVTMPHKQIAFQISKPDDIAQSVEAVNTLRLLPDDILATNTDIVGVQEPLKQSLNEGTFPEQLSVLILGYGGAARAAAVACKNLDMTVTVAVRKKRLSALTRHNPLQLNVVPWDHRSDVSAEILINATPVSGQISPWPQGKRLEKKIVFDLAITGQHSTLLRQAATENITTIDAQAIVVCTRRGTAALADANGYNTR